MGENTENTDTVPMGRPAPPGPPLSLARGTLVGRYVILEPVGSGGMGVVFAAYDPELDRKVALKLLRPGRAGEAARLRLLREAQAVAKLSHPNIVAVHDAGSLGDQVFMAMELVQGQTLRQWIEAAPRSWREVLAVLLPAARGLAAAHAAGLVHRDVKPENVLIGEDGRVRVADFGLVRRADRPDEVEVFPPSPPASQLATPLTGHGIALGTPSYMAPEQLRGEPADPRSDQYGYCVTLWEALFGKRPPAGENRRVPSWLRQTLLRGLSEDPAARHPSMEALVADLDRDPAATRRRWLAVAAVVLAAGASLFAWEWGKASRAGICGGAGAKLARVWSPDRKQAVAAAFAATGAPFAESTRATVERELDRHTSRWAAMHREACEATRLRGEQSEDLLDRRMFCLDQRLHEIDAVAGLFARADRQVLEKAVSLATDLPSLAACADVAALTAKLPPPRDPGLRARVEAGRARVAEVEAWSDAGKHAEALVRAQAAAETARRLGYPPLRAEALYHLGWLQDATGASAAAEETLFEALLAAQEAGSAEMVARAASQLSLIVGAQESRAADGHRWARLALATVEGFRGSDALRAELLKNLASILNQERRSEEAVAVATRALALAERGSGLESPQAAYLLTNLGIYSSDLGKPEEAIRFVRRGLEIREKVLPPGHPDFGRSHNTLGNIYLDLHREDEALAAFQRALEAFRQAYGGRHPLVAGVLNNMGIAHKNRERFAAARRYYGQSAAIFEAVYGPEHRYVAMALGNLGEVNMLEGRFAEALAIFRRTLAIDEKLLGPDHPDVAFSLIGQALTLLMLGRAGEAVAPAERALALREGRQLDSDLLNEARFTLARALWDGGGDRMRALRLARQARAGYASAPASANMVQKVDAWLKTREKAGDEVTR